MTNVFLYPSFFLASHTIYHLHHSDMRMFQCVILSLPEKAYRGWQVWSLGSSDWTDMTVTVPQAYFIPICLGCSMMSPSGMQDFCNTLIFHHISTPPLCTCFKNLRLFTKAFMFILLLYCTLLFFSAADCGNCWSRKRNRSLFWKCQREK